MKENDSIKGFTEKDKTILTGRVYPNVLACVNNRYKIILGFFAYYAFIVNAKKIISQPINLVASIIFSLFVIHNLINYWTILLDEYKHEKINGKKTPVIEIIFTGIALFLIWGAFFIVKLPMK